MMLSQDYGINRSEGCKRKPNQILTPMMLSQDYGINRSEGCKRKPISKR